MQAMLLSNQHDWVAYAASGLALGGEVLWQAMCHEWAATCIDAEDAKVVVQPIEDALVNAGSGGILPEPIVSLPNANESGLLF
jgi:hypothetical protein